MEYTPTFFKNIFFTNEYGYKTYYTSVPGKYVIQNKVKAQEFIANRSFIQNPVLVNYGVTLATYAQNEHPPKDLFAKCMNTPQKIYRQMTMGTVTGGGEETGPTSVQFQA